MGTERGGGLWTDFELFIPEKVSGRARLDARACAKGSERL
jgi:hypothetical protein